MNQRERIKKLTVEIDEDLHRWVRIKAARTGQSIRDVVEHILKAAREQEQDHASHP